MELYWLGPPAVEHNGCPLRLETRKSLALLAYLSLSPQSPTREYLAAMFWPEDDQQHALASLRRSRSSLAGRLPAGLLRTDRETIGLEKVDWLKNDVDEFHTHVAFCSQHSHPVGALCIECIAHLEQAAAIYRGNFLQGFNLSDCPEFDRWQDFQRESLRSEYADAMHRLSLHYQGSSQWEKGIRHVQSWLALDRMNEPAHRLLIDLYRRAGQRGMALHQYEVLSSMLQDELGQAAEPETLSLYRSLLGAEEPGGAANRPAIHGTIARGPEPLIKTKLFIPPLRVHRVARPRLFELLDAGGERSLTLVSAPAGFGKTTLLTSWTAHTDLPIAWFSIDEGDNDPFRFFAYLIAALESVLSSDLSEQINAVTQSMQTSLRPALIELLNHLAEEREPFVLILDDYQFIHSTEVHEALAFLLERIPASMHLIIATRADPPISLALLRARDQLVEVRMSDLRFSMEESAGFMRQVMSLPLSNEDVSALEARTEGWIAGLQMAALAIRTVTSRPAMKFDPTDKGQVIPQFIKAFSGSNRYIMDYLGEEVLNRCPPRMRDFLLQTSILERFSGSLSEAVTGLPESQQILEELEKEDLFLIPLDSERHWYRYHHLFAELLRIRLEEALARPAEREANGLGSLEQLHLRAAEWFEKNQLIGEAIQHFLAAREYSQAAALMEAQAYPMLLTTGQVYTLQEWLDALPRELYSCRPRLYMAKAWTLILHNQFDPAMEQLETCSQVLEGGQDREDENLLGEIALARGVLAELRTRDVEDMRTQGLLAWEKLPSEQGMLRGLAGWLLGASYYFDGDLDHAEYYLKQAIQLCQEAGNIFIASVAIQELSNVRMEQGRYREAYRLLLQALQEISAGRRHTHPGLGYLCYVLSRILLSWDELGEAERQLRLGIDLMARGIPGEMLIMSTSLLAHIKLAQGSREEALHLAEESLQRAEAYPFPYIPSMVKASLVGFWIRVGNQRQIEEWLRNCGLAADDTIRYVHEAEYIAFSKVLIWQGRTDEALQVVAQLYDLAQSSRRHGKLFYIVALEAVALLQADDLDGSLRALRQSLTLAQPDGHIRPYVEEGKPMEELLQVGAGRGIWAKAGLEGYVNRLLQAIRQDQAQRPRVEGQIRDARSL